MLAALARRVRAVARGPASRSTGDGEDGPVACPDCDTDNERGYRFCRNCASELPGAASFGRSSGSSLGRFSA